ncbi:MAG: hypothetical protein ACOX9E_01090 [Lentisphaeria bacterium]
MDKVDIVDRHLFPVRSAEPSACFPVVLRISTSDRLREKCSHSSGRLFFRVMAGYIALAADKQDWNIDNAKVQVQE